MKKFITLALAALLVAASFSACNNDDSYTIGDIYPTALVTVKPTDGNNSCYLQLDNTTTLRPVNLKGSPYGTKPVRALVNYVETEDDPAPYTYAVRVLWMDDILTKEPVQWGTMSQEELGDDPLEIVKDWVTLVEDGYLTLRFRTMSSGLGVTHFLNLVKGVNPDNPYEVHLRHNAYEDTAGDLADGIVAFDLSSLPQTNDPNAKLKLVWTSFSGEKSVEFYLNGDPSNNSTPYSQVATPSIDVE